MKTIQFAVKWLGTDGNWYETAPCKSRIKAIQQYEYLVANYQIPLPADDEISVIEIREEI